MELFSAVATNGDPTQAARALLADLLAKDVVKGVLVPARQGRGTAVAQRLIVDPALMASAEPFAPVVPVSGARLAASLTARPPGQPLAAVLRSCEIRAFIELTKLHQGNIEDLLVIAVDCLGRFENRDFAALSTEGEDLALSFLKAAGDGASARILGRDLPAACTICEHPVAEHADLRLCFIGGDPAATIWVEWVSEKGRQAQAALAREAGTAPAGRAAALTALVERRRTAGAQHLGAFRERTGDLASLAQEVASCVACTNCRVACPVCYCRHCVFTTETFNHDGEDLVRAAGKWGAVRLPADNVFYHLTRMVHVGTLCVGCGQCSSACPNDVPVMELIRTMAERAQARFAYHPGRSLTEPQPLATFQADELPDVTGQVK
jgi:formate dehydrogenase subunit beta